jgi:signal transduction histidine kinase/CheY-like chemotaxis protein
VAKVLVVDDQAANRELVVTLLNHAGHAALEAGDGPMGLALVRTERPDLVICDILMPTMDGYEFVRQLRADAAIAATTVIFYTATFMEREARTLAQSCGVSLVLVKPSEPQVVLETVARALAGPKVHTAATVIGPEFDREHLQLLTDKLALKVLDLENTNRRLAALTELNMQIVSGHDPEALLDAVCHGARELIGARYAVLAIRERNGGSWMSLTTAGMETTGTDRLRRSGPDTGLLDQVMADRRGKRFDNPGGEPMSIGLPADFPPVHCGLIAPIVSLQRSYGWILMADKLGAERFSDEDQRLLEIQAAQTGRIYENGTLYNELKRTTVLLQQEVLERKRTAQALHTLNETLEQRVGARTAELKDIIDGLESFNRSVSHDLRGPLGGIAGAARLANDAIARDDKAKAGQLLKMIGGQAETTGRLVDALLMLARVSGAQLTRQRVDMTALVREVIGQTPQALAGQPLPVVLDTLPAAEVDPALARQVFGNLIGNGLKFASEALRPLVSIGAEPLTHPPIYFVRDNGVGFDASRAEQLFRPFQRLHGTRFEGSGVGLSIVKRIIDRHGGRIWAESAPGLGATFYFGFGSALEQAAGAGGSSIVH